MIELRTFDTVELTAGADGNADALLSQPKRFALLCFLAIPNPGTLHRRDTLLGLFWPEGDSEHTRTSLRQALAHIRKALGRDVILRRGSEEVGLNPDLLWCDVGAFERALDDCKWSEAIELYRGDLLKGLFVSQAPEFERWLETERARLAGRYAGALEELANAAMAAGKTRAAVEWWQSLVLHDPYDSRLAIGLMEALERAGDPANALLHARQHTELLREELGIAPPAEFEAAVQWLRATSATRPVEHGTSERASPSNATSGASQVEMRKPARPVWKSRVAAAGILALVTMVVGTMLLARGNRVTLDPGPVVVAAFRNATGDPALDHLGERAGHWITQGIQKAAVPVTPWDIALQSWEYVQTELEAGRVRDPIRALAEEASAKIVVTGTVYLAGNDTLEVQTSLTDARRGRLLGMLEPVRGSRFSDSELLTGVQERVMAFLSIRFEELFRDWVPDMTAEPPSFEAQQEYAEGCRQLLGGENEAAILHLTRAVELDSTFVLPLHRLVSAYGNLARNAERDSVFRVLEEYGDRLTPFDRATVEARSLDAERDFEGALRAFQRAAELAPGSPEEALYGYAAIKANRPRLAKSILSSMDPERGYFRKSTRYWTWLIGAHLMLGDVEEALEVVRRGRQMHPDNIWLMREHAWVLAPLGRIDEMSRVLDEVESAGNRNWNIAFFWPQTIEGLRYYGYTDAATTTAERAVSWFEAKPAFETMPYMGAEPSDEAATFIDRVIYGRVLFLAGRTDDAQEVLDKVVGDFPGANWVLGRMWRAFVAAQRGDSARALSDADSLEILAEQTEGPDRDWTRLWLRGVIYGALGNHERAMALFREYRGQWFHWSYDHIRLLYEPMRGYPPFEEFLRPKG